MKKAQTSVEFLLLVAFGTLIFVVFFGVIQDRILVANNQQSSQELDRLNQLIASEINLGFRFSNGYEREFWLPLTVGGLRYNATINNNRTLVTNSSDITNLYFFDKPVYGQLNIGENKLIGLNDAVYLNKNLEEILTITIDGKESDWKALQDFYEITPIQDNRRDFYPDSPTQFLDWDLKSLMIWNDNKSMFFLIELYEDNIKDFDLPINNNLVDFVILLDTVAGTGYTSSNPSKIITELGVDYIITDKGGRIDRTIFTWGSNYFTNTNPLGFVNSAPTTDFYFATISGGSPMTYNFINDNKIELSIPLSKISINPANEQVIRYSVIARENSTQITDYLPGDHGFFTGGYYKVQNR